MRIQDNKNYSHNPIIKNTLFNSKNTFLLPYQSLLGEASPEHLLLSLAQQSLENKWIFCTQGVRLPPKEQLARYGVLTDRIIFVKKSTKYTNVQLLEKLIQSKTSNTLITQFKLDLDEKYKLKSLAKDNNCQLIFEASPILQ